MHGRDLLSQGLVQKIGNGTSYRVWIDNWLIDNVSRTPQYPQDSTVDLTLPVSDLIDPHRDYWNVAKVLGVISAEDVERVMNTKIDISTNDRLEWGLSKNGIYNVKSGYALAETV